MLGFDPLLRDLKLTIALVLLCICACELQAVTCDWSGDAF